MKNPSLLASTLAAAGLSLLSSTASAVVEFATFSPNQTNSPGNVVANATGTWSLSNITITSTSNNAGAVFGYGQNTIGPINAGTFINSPTFTAPYGNLFTGYVNSEARNFTQTITTNYVFTNLLQPSSNWQMLLHNVDLGETATIRAYNAANVLIPIGAAFSAPTFLDVQEPQDANQALVHPTWNAATGTLNGLGASTFDSLAIFNPLAAIKRIEVDYFMPGGATAQDFQGGEVAFVVPIPEPGTALAGLALAGVVTGSRRRKLS